MVSSARLPRSPGSAHPEGARHRGLPFDGRDLALASGQAAAMGAHCSACTPVIRGTRSIHPSVLSSLKPFLGDLVGVRLLPLVAERVIGAAVVPLHPPAVDESPVRRVDLRVVAPEPDQLGPEKHRLRHLGHRRLVRAEHHAPESRPRCIGRRRGGLVPRGVAAQDAVAELPRLRCRHRDRSVLERAGRIAGGVGLDPQLAHAARQCQALGAQEGVPPSPRVTILSGSPMGSSSIQRQTVAGRRQSASRSSSRPSRTRSYCASSRLSHAGHSRRSRSEPWAAPHLTHTKPVKYIPVILQ
jgi:hypothetical protein